MPLCGYLPTQVKNKEGSEASKNEEKSVTEKSDQ
jgi:hypothetical protein